MEIHRTGYATMLSHVIKSGILVLTVALIAMSLACDGDRECPACPNNERDYFPNSLGDQWIYATFDSLSMTADTVLVRVAGRITYENRELTVREHHLDTRVDSEYVEITSDTIRIYRYLDNPWVSTVYVIPFVIGNGWRGDHISDTNDVIRREPAVVPAGEFCCSILIEERWGAFNDYGRIHTWYQPEIGILKKHHVGWSFGMANQVWELIGWDVAY